MEVIKESLVQYLKLNKSLRARCADLEKERDKYVSLVVELLTEVQRLKNVVEGLTSSNIDRFFEIKRLKGE